MVFLIVLSLLRSCVKPSKLYSHERHTWVNLSVKIKSVSINKKSQLRQQRVKKMQIRFAIKMWRPTKNSTLLSRIIFTDPFTLSMFVRVKLNKNQKKALQIVSLYM